MQCMKLYTEETTNLKYCGYWIDSSPRRSPWKGPSPSFKKCGFCNHLGTANSHNPGIWYRYKIYIAFFWKFLPSFWASIRQASRVFFPMQTSNLHGNPPMQLMCSFFHEPWIFCWQKKRFCRHPAFVWKKNTWPQMTQMCCFFLNQESSIFFITPG